MKNINLVNHRTDFLAPFTFYIKLKNRLRLNDLRACSPMCANAYKGQQTRKGL